MQDFAAYAREQAKNIATKRLQPDQPFEDFWSFHKQKNPGSAATETGIKSKVKASSFPLYLTPNLDVEATCNQGDKLLPDGAS